MRFPRFGGSGVLLFDEDFDLPPPSTEPEVIEPVFTAAELHGGARRSGARKPRRARSRKSMAPARAAAGRALTEIASANRSGADGRRIDRGTISRGDRALAARLFRGRVSGVERAARAGEVAAVLRRDFARAAPRAEDHRPGQSASRRRR